MIRKNYDSGIELSDSHWWFVGRSKIIKSVLNKYLVKNTSNHILEIGCGSGSNLKLLSQLGKLEAFELDQSSRSHAIKKNNINVKYGKLPYDISFNKKYDSIFLLDVLEHIEEDSESILSIHRALNIKGKLIITVPAFMFLWSKHDVSSGHKRRYTKHALNQLLEKSGFKIKYSSYFNFFLFPLIFFIRLKNKLIKKIDENDFKKENIFINFILKSIFSFEKVFIPKFSFPFGVSIIVYAEKNET